jgi:hypothetical protein
VGGLAGHGEPAPASRPPELLPPLLELLPPELLALLELLPPELLALPELDELLLVVPELLLAVPELLLAAPELPAPELDELPPPELLLPVLPLVPELPESEPSPLAPPSPDAGIVNTLPPHADVAASATTIKILECIAASARGKSDASTILKVYEERRYPSNVRATSRGDARPHARASWATSLARRSTRSTPRQRGGARRASAACASARSGELCGAISR